MNEVNTHIKELNGSLKSHADIFLHNIAQTSRAEDDKLDEAVKDILLKIVVVGPEIDKDFILSVVDEWKSKRTCKCGDCKEWDETKRMPSGLVIGDCRICDEIKAGTSECEIGKYVQR